MLVGFFLAGCAFAETAEPILARVGDVAITVREFETEWAKAVRSAPQGASAESLRRPLLEEMIGFRLRVLAAKEAGIDRDPEIVALLERALVRRFEEQWEQAHRAGLEVDESEIEAAYRAAGERFRLPERVRGALLWVSAPKGSDRERARRRAESALAAARALPSSVPDLGSVAAENSEERSSRYRGGDIGWLTPPEAGRWPAEVVTALFALESPGSFAPLVETPDGFYVVRLVAREVGTLQPIESVRELLRAELLRAKRKEWTRQQSAALAASHPVVVDDDLFRTLVPIVVSPPPLPGER